MLGRIGALVVVVAISLTGVGCGGTTACGDDAPRAQVDLAPLHADCSTDVNVCAAPYQCITYDYYVGLGPEPPVLERTLCEVPCADDRDCPDGFFCQGQCQVGEAGLPAGFCLENI